MRRATTPTPGAEEPVRYELLGPLRAWRGDVVLDLGPPQQRVILAVLLLHANTSVSQATLVDAVWGEAAPTYAVNLLQKRISALRRTLDDGRSAGSLTWDGSGYLLAVMPDSLDLAAFEQAGERAHRAVAAGDLATAESAIRAGLRLWRGPALDGLISPLLDVERQRMAEHRAAMVEQHAEVQLALGNHAQLVGELGRLVAEYPLREHLRGLLMVCLYRSGRQSEALAAFHDTRRHLQDELGIEPGPELQHLHERILNADPALALERTSVADQPTARIEMTTPAQLPHGIADFAGRQSALAALNSLLDADGGSPQTFLTIAISGTAGVGKTTLAVQWGHHVKHRYPDGQLYVNLRGFDPGAPPMIAADAIRGFLDALGISSKAIPVNLDAQVSLYRSVLAERRMLLVLDNARDAEQARPLLPGSPQCLVVITSRNRLTGLVREGAHPLTLDLPSSDEARELLGRRIGTSEVAKEPGAVDEIIGLCARLPLALAVVGARATTNPNLSLGQLARDLGETRDSLDAFDDDDDATDVRGVLSWSYDLLSAQSARLLRLLALHPGPDISALAVSSLSALAPRVLRPVLAELSRSHLLTERVHGRFAFHDILRAYARELAMSEDDEPDRSAAVRRVLQFYAHTAVAADRRINPHRDAPVAVGPPPADVAPAAFADHASAHEWFATEHSVLMAVIGLGMDHGLYRATWQLAWAMSPYLEYDVHWHDWLQSQTAGLGAATVLGDPQMQARSSRLVGRAQTKHGNSADGRKHLDEALRLYVDLADRLGQAYTLLDIAFLLDWEDRHREAVTHAAHALDLFAATGDQVGRGRSLNAVGWFRLRSGDYDEGRERCEEALQLQEEIGDRLGQAATADSLGLAFWRLGQYGRSVEFYGRAVRLFDEFEDHFNRGKALTDLGEVHLETGDVAATRDTWNQAVAIFDQLHHPAADAIRAQLADLRE